MPVWGYSRERRRVPPGGRLATLCRTLVLLLPFQFLAIRRTGRLPSGRPSGACRYRVGYPRDALADKVFRNRCVAQDEGAAAVIRPAIGVTGRHLQGINPDAAATCQAVNLERRGQLLRHVPREVHSTFPTTQCDVLEMTSERRCQTITACKVDPANAPEVGFVPPARDEFSKHRLVEPGVAVVEQSLNADGRSDELGWHHHVTDPQPRADCFGEGAQIDDRPLPVQSLQGHKRRPVMTEVAVVVILDDVRPRSSRPVEKLEAPLEGQCISEWKLVGRRYVSEADAALRQPQDIKALGVDVYRNEAAPVTFEHKRRSLVAGTFSGDACSWSN